MAGLIALTQTDLKRVLAYSTVSQLGYMFLGLGTGTLAGITAGMFHLFTHAFFKALLFLGAGSVMHAMDHVIDMRHFSGLRHIMPWTHRTFLVRLPGPGRRRPVRRLLEQGHDPRAPCTTRRTSTAPYHQIYQVLYYGGVFTAFLTAFYTFRAFFLTFFGPLKTPAEAASSARVAAGDDRAAGDPGGVARASVGCVRRTDARLTRFLWHTPSLTPRRRRRKANRCRTTHGLAIHFDVAAMSTVVALAGIGLAAFMYLGNRTEAEQLAELTQHPQGPVALSTFAQQVLLRRNLHGASSSGRSAVLAWLSYFVDRYVIDGLVNLVRLGSAAGRRAAPLAADRHGAVLRPGDGAGHAGAVRLAALDGVVRKLANVKLAMRDRSRPTSLHVHANDLREPARRLHLAAARRRRADLRCWPTAAASSRAGSRWRRRSSRCTGPRKSRARRSRSLPSFDARLAHRRPASTSASASASTA